MKNFGKIFSLLVIAIMMLTFLSACSASAEEPTSEATAVEETGTAEDEVLEVVYAETSILTTTNPAIGWSDYYLRGLTQESLIDDALLGGLKPGLATDWSVDESGTVWTFNIRDGVTFHDGTVCDANAIAWSLNFTIENELPTMLSYVDGISSVEAVDDLTLQITTEEPIGSFETRMSGLGLFILPESVWGNMTSDEVLEYEEIDASMGTGPYQIVEFVPNEYVILEPYEDHWAGKPAIDRIVFREFSNADAVYEALRSGEADIAPISPDAVELLVKEEHLHILNSPAWAINEMIINSFAEGTQPESLKDIVVRRAMAQAVDKQQMINVVSSGVTTPGWSLLTPDNGEWYNSEVEDISYNLDEANRLLDEAGYVDTDGDGIRNWSDGSNLQYRLYSGDDMDNGPRVIEMISANLKEIGIYAEPQVLSAESVIALYPAYDFDLLYWGWEWGGMDPDFPMSCFTCDQASDGGWNDAGYCNPEFDELYLAQARETDQEARKEIVWDMQEVFFNDLPYVVLEYDVNLMAVNQDKLGFMIPLAEEYGHPLVHAIIVGVDRP